MNSTDTGKVSERMWGGGHYSTSHHTALHGVLSSDALARVLRLLHIGSYTFWLALILVCHHCGHIVTCNDALTRRLWVQVHPLRTLPSLEIFQHHSDMRGVWDVNKKSHDVAFPRGCLLMDRWDKRFTDMKVTCILCIYCTTRVQALNITYCVHYYFFIHLLGDFWVIIIKHGTSAGTIVLVDASCVLFWIRCGFA